MFIMDAPEQIFFGANETGISVRYSSCLPKFINVPMQTELEAKG